MFDFPSSPALNDTYTSSGLTYVYNGYGWVPASAGGTGTLTQINAGTGITLTPSPITATGSVALGVPVAIANGGTNAITSPLALDSLSGASGATAGVLSRASGGSWSVTAAGGAGTVTSITAGTGITLTPSPISAAGAVALSVPVSIANGGTNATSASAALTSLGAYPAANPSGYQTAAQVTTALVPYALLASPVFTGDPRAPTPATADNDTSIATTAYVQAQGYLTQTNAALGYAPIASPTFTGNPTAPTAPPTDNDTSIATTAYVKNQGYQTGNQSIALSGDIAGTGTTAITTTLATVNANVGTFQGITVNAKGLVTAAANQSYAPLASPTFSGTPSLPTGTTGITQTAAINNTTLATTAFVQQHMPVIISDTAPTPSAGMLWFDSAGGHLYLYYTDPNTSQWIVIL